MRPYKPAPKNASANRIRERYLHQLGLQRGGAPLTAPHLSQSNHVVVISGLPSLPEDRATTTEHVMESHDFSISRHSQHTGNSSSRDHCDDDMDDDSISGVHKDVHSICSKSTLSASPSAVAGLADASLKSMALAYPTALRKVPLPTKQAPNPADNPFSMSHSVPWRTSLSKPAAVLLDSADHDSVSSAGTSTTAESSLMVTRDWGAVPHTATSSAAVSISSQGGESPASAPGVYFQCGHPRLLSGVPSTGASCAASSLAHALNRFNIDSDCETASVASNSIVDDHIMDTEDDASCASVTSHASAGSSVRSQHARNASTTRKGKKIGKTQRLMDRAAAHERIIKRGSDRSQTMRASLVQSQRMGVHSRFAVVSGLSSAMARDEAAQPSRRSPSGSASSSQASSTQLVHVKHATPPEQAEQAAFQLGALGRTPTASNCSDIHKLRSLVKPPGCYLSHLEGVHISANAHPTSAMPLGFHPRLASRIHAPPPRLAPNGTISIPATSQALAGPFSKPSFANVESREDVDSSTSSLQHKDHPPTTAATVDDVMEVAMTLSKLGGTRTTGPVPRIR